MTETSRRLMVLLYHFRRMIGASDPDEIALLGSDKHPITCAWLVQRVDGDKSFAFNIPKLEGRVQVNVVRGQDLPRRDSKPPIDPSIDDDSDNWFLLASGHSRHVLAVLPVSSVDSLRQFELQLGKERLSERLGNEVFRAEETAILVDARKNFPLAVYSEIGAQMRALMDIRFKLLALFPPLSAIALVSVISPDGPLKGVPRFVRVIAALAGAVITLGLRIYDVRNSQLYDDLVSRGRSVEAALGVERGPYMRRRSSLWPLQHELALQLIYGAILLAWSGAVILAGFL
jgi:hypothetical protein